jgi:hypothetical protein
VRSEHATLIIAVDCEAGSQLESASRGHASAGQSQMQHMHVVLLPTVFVPYMYMYTVTRDSIMRYLDGYT